MNLIGNFWKDLKRPIFCLAPMADVTDAAFRYIIAKNSNINYVTYTEFVSADGLILAPEKGKQKLLKNLEYSEIERPIVAQIFGSNPENIEKAAALIAKLGFDGVDINMGCPDKSIEKQGAGAALIKNSKLAREIISAAKRGVLRSHLRKSPKGETLGIPVSVKTRLGYNKDELEEWLPELLTENPAAIVIHARTRKEMSKVPARWERIKRTVEIRNNFVAVKNDSLHSHDASHISLRECSLPLKTLIIGNGDVKDIADATKKCEKSGADGAMFGRAIFGNPWLFADYEPTMEERFRILAEHTKLFEERFNGVKSFSVMKKHFKGYLKLLGLEDLKYKLMKAKSAEEALEIMSNFRPPID